MKLFVSRTSTYVLIASLVMIGGVVILTRSTETVEIHALYKGFDNIGALEEDAQVIVVGRPKDSFEDSEHVVMHFPNGTLETFHTLRRIDVERVIKKPASLDLSAGQTFIISEPIGLVDMGGGPVRMKYEDYGELKKGGKYIIFLKTNGTSEQYGVINMNLGKFNLDGTDSGDEDGKKLLLKKSILTKYML